MQSSCRRVNGLICRLLVPIRDRTGRTRFEETPSVLWDLFNLGRHMYLVQFADGTTIYVFQHEVELMKMPSRSGCQDKSEKCN